MVRLRHRYVVAEVQMEEDWKTGTITRGNAILGAITKSVRDLHGIQGVALSKAGLFAKYVNHSTKIVFIRMRRSAYEIVTSSLPFVTRLDNHPMSFRTLYTGATIRHCNIFLQKYHRRELETKYGSLKSDLQRKLFEKELEKIPQLSIKMGLS